MLHGTPGGCNVLARGVDVYRVSKGYGHSSPKMTEHYVKILASEFEDLYKTDYTKPVQTQIEQLKLIEISMAFWLAGECHPHTVEVEGSNPLPPTTEFNHLRVASAARWCFLLPSRYCCSPKTASFELQSALV